MSADLEPCATCGGPIGDHLGECPAGAIAMFSELDRGTAATLASVPAENLRLSVVDQNPEQPTLFEELTP